MKSKRIFSLVAFCGIAVFAAATANRLEASPSLRDLERRAEKGDPQAALSLGMRYRDGKGVKRDYETAVHWYRKSADAGLGAGLDNVGFMYLRGWGVPQDSDIAAAYFKAGAKKGDAQALFNLGKCYFSGRGVEQSYGRAVATWERAAEGQSANAIWRLAMMHASGEEIPQDRKKAATHCRRLAEKGHVNGMLLLGELCALKGDQDAACGWWEKAARRGSTQGAALLKLSKWRGEKPESGMHSYIEVTHLFQGWNNCGATSIAMFARHGGGKVTPYDVKRLCPQSPIGTGTDWAHLVSAGTELGEQWKLVTFPNDKTGFTEGSEFIRGQLDRRRAVVIDFTVERDENGKIRRFGHTLLIVGYNSKLDQYVLKNPNQPSPGIELMSATELKESWHSRGYSRSAKGKAARPLIVLKD